MSKVQAITVAAIVFVGGCAGLAIVFHYARRVHRRRGTRMALLLHRYRDKHYQACPNCHRPYSEWFVHEGRMYCFPCSVHVFDKDHTADLPTSLFQSNYTTHASWRADPGAPMAACSWRSRVDRHTHTLESRNE